MTRIVEIENCKMCPYFHGEAYSVFPGEKAHLPESREAFSGCCYHPSFYNPDIRNARYGRPISQNKTDYKDGFPIWCELEIKDPAGGFDNGGYF